MTQSRCFNRAFTVPEMLAVVAVIVILLSLLLPSIVKARQAAERSVCGSNLHQLSMANRLYAMENRGRNVHERPEALSWMLKLSPFLGGSSGDKETRVSSMNSIPQFRCPTASKPGAGPSASLGFLGTATEAWGPIQTGNGREGLIGSYGLNMWTEAPEQVPDSAAGPDAWHFAKLAHVSEPSNSPLLGDCIWDGGGWPGGNIDGSNPSPPVNPYSPTWTEGSLARFAMYRHFRGVNMAFFDGSSRWVTFEGVWGLKWHNNFKPLAGPPWQPVF